MRILLFGLMLAFTVVHAAPGHADLLRDWNQAEGDVSIEACSKIINGSDLDNTAMSNIYYNRALAYDGSDKAKSALPISQCP